MLKNRKGFTMLEMLIVIGVIAMLLTLIVPNLSKKQELINSKGCEALLETINTQVYLYYVDTGKYPNTIDTLLNDNYLKKEQTSCNDKKITLKDNVATLE